MRRFFLIAVLVGLVALLAAGLAIGLFPPRARIHTVQKSVPASTFEHDAPPTR